MGKGSARERPLMVIGIANLSEGERPFNFTVDAEGLNLDELGVIGDVSVSGVISKVSNQFFLTGEVVTQYIKNCDRCLAETERDIRAKLALYYRVTADGQLREEDDGDVEVRALKPEQTSIVLDEEVRQTILLEFPMQFLCRPDCRGLCPRCGVDLNLEECRCEGPEIDPRWAKLAELMKDKRN